MGQYEFPFRISIEVMGVIYTGNVVPFKLLLPCGLPYFYRVVFDDVYFGDLQCKDGIWQCEGKDAPMVETISNYIELWYE
jgi:hypothetical protein